jgi:microcin C transport system permease protein
VAAYILRRLLLIIPTLLGIMVVNFFVIQAAPGGPVDQMIAQLKGRGGGGVERVGGGTGGEVGTATSAAQASEQSRAARGIDPQLIKQLEKEYGFDKPPVERFLMMMRNYLSFDFGTSFYSSRSVIGLIKDKMPVSISIGLWTTLITYLVSIPLGIRKAVLDGTRFDFWTSTVIIVGNAIPAFLFAVLLIVLFAGGKYLSWFPLRGLHSDDAATLDWPNYLLDYFWHIALPIFSLVIGSFASLTMLTKNSFLEEIGKQ